MSGSSGCRVEGVWSYNFTEGRPFDRPVVKPLTASYMY